MPHKPAVMVHACNLRTWTWKQEKLKFEVILSYAVILKPEASLGYLISKQTNKQKRKMLIPTSTLNAIVLWVSNLLFTLRETSAATLLEDRVQIAL